MRFQYFVPVLVLCVAQFTNCKPTTDYLTEGRGIGSTLWGWISYPFSWWSSEPAPVNDQLIGPPTYGPFDNIEIAKRNVTVWCNDQTCTTMKCDKFGCKNVTCNIYDTDMRGECREYNTDLKPEEPAPPKPTQAVVTVSTPASTVSTAATSTTVTSEQPSPAEEHPLELEAVLSSTVTESIPEKVSQDAKGNKSSSPQNKV
ncbi:hypothetical protein O0L34_g6123 [Tuta absoluta]|nr:hypothetical protein O0L34_g6123 [Tuta absoluta]